MPLSLRNAAQVTVIDRIQLVKLNSNCGSAGWEVLMGATEPAFTKDGAVVELVWFGLVTGANALKEDEGAQVECFL